MKRRSFVSTLLASPIFGSVTRFTKNPAEPTEPTGTEEDFGVWTTAIAGENIQADTRVALIGPTTNLSRSVPLIALPDPEGTAKQPGIAAKACKKGETVQIRIIREKGIVK